jgi:uncharacterized protein (TIGR01777 family)
MTDTTAASITTSANPQLHPGAPLRIIIPGGEGHLGRLVSRRLSCQGHLVTTLTRSPIHSSATAQRELPRKPKAWETAVWDGKSLGLWVERLEHADLLINLAGRSVDCRYTASNRAAILQSRMESTTILGKAIKSLRFPPLLWLNASTATIYRHSFDRNMDEATGELGGDELDTPETWRFSIDVARQWERCFFVSDTPRTRKIALRSAMVMSVEPGGVFEVLLRLVRSRLGGAWGAGRQYMSWIHEEDFLRAVEFLMERDTITGVVNLAAPDPLPNEQFLSHLRKAWGTSIGLPAKKWMLELGASFLRTETELLLKSRRVVPGVLQNHGFEFLFPQWPDAANDLVRRWRTKAATHASSEFIQDCQEATVERAN